MKVKEIRLKVPEALHEELKIAAKSKMLRIGTFTRQMIIDGLRQFEESDPERKYYISKDSVV